MLSLRDTVPSLPSLPIETPGQAKTFPQVKRLIPCYFFSSDSVVGVVSLGSSCLIASPLVFAVGSSGIALPQPVTRGTDEITSTVAKRVSINFFICI